MTAEEHAARQLIAEHGASIRRFARHIAGAVPFAIDPHDLWPVGLTAAWQASLRYRAGAGASPGGWVRHAAWQAMVDEAFWLATGRMKQRDRSSPFNRDGTPRATRRPGTLARMRRVEFDALEPEALHDRAAGPERAGVVALIVRHARAILSPVELRVLLATAAGWTQPEIAASIGSRRQSTASEALRRASAKLRDFYGRAA